MSVVCHESTHEVYPPRRPPRLPANPTHTPAWPPPSTCKAGEITAFLSPSLARESDPRTRGGLASG